jgi:hypothetical protein
MKPKLFFGTVNVNRIDATQEKSAGYAVLIAAGAAAVPAYFAPYGMNCIEIKP